MPTYTVDNAAIYLTPLNWVRNGSTYAQTNTPGAYIKTKFTGTSLQLEVDVSPLVGASVDADNYPRIVAIVDGLRQPFVQLDSSSETVTLATGLSDTLHSVTIYFAAIVYDDDRWITPELVLRVTGLTADAISAPSIRPRHALMYADSNGEGVEAVAAVVSAATQDARLAFPILLGEKMDAEVSVVAFAGQGYATAVVASGVPSLQDAWDFFWDGESRLSGGLFIDQPDYILFFHGQNEVGDITLWAEDILAGCRAAAPDARIVFCVPPIGTHASELEGVVDDAADPDTVFIDIEEVVIGNPLYTHVNHLTQVGHEYYADRIFAEFATAFPDDFEPEVDMALTDNLVAYYKLDETSGNATDSHGDNDLTDNNSVGTAAGKVGTGRDFEASSSQFLSIASNGNLQWGNISATCAVWVKLESKTGFPMIFAKVGAAGSEYCLFYNDSEDRFTFRIGDATDVSANNLGSPQLGVWYFIVCWHDSVGDTINIQVNNGTATSAATGANFGAANAAQFRLGSRSNAGSELYFDGVIDEFGMWKRLLTADEKTELYNGGNGKTYPFTDPLVAGTVALVSKTDTTVTLEFTAATGGTEPYTYDLYRDDVLIASDIDVGEEYEDTGLTAATEYSYVLRVTDDATATEDSDPLEVTTEAASGSAWSAYINDVYADGVWADGVWGDGV